MGRSQRAVEDGLVYHVLNRGNARRAFLHKPGDYEAWLRVLAEAKEAVPMRVLAYCLMPNHWHLVLWPEHGEDLSRFVGWLSQTHTQRWHAHYHNVGTGHLYQGRFKSFPVQEDGHFYSLCRYVERNALRAGLVERAEDWEWGSLWDRVHGDGGVRLLSPWPVVFPDSWVEQVNEAQSERELQALRRCVKRGLPYGEKGWVETTARRLGLTQALRPLGRPRKRREKTEEAVQRTLFD
jgi:putative transposase